MTEPAAGAELEPLAEEEEELTPELVASVRALEPRPAQLPAVQAAAVAATGFVAGAATVVVMRRRAVRRATRRDRRRARRPAQLLDVVASRSFLVDVHLLGRE